MSEDDWDAAPVEFPPSEGEPPLALSRRPGRVQFGPSPNVRPTDLSPPQELAFRKALERHTAALKRPLAPEVVDGLRARLAAYAVEDFMARRNPTVAELRESAERVTGMLTDLLSALKRQPRRLREALDMSFRYQHGLSFDRAERTLMTMREHYASSCDDLRELAPQGGRPSGALRVVLARDLKAMLDPVAGCFAVASVRRDWLNATMRALMAVVVREELPADVTRLAPQKTSRKLAEVSRT